MSATSEEPISLHVYAKIIKVAHDCYKYILVLYKPGVKTTPYWNGEHPTGAAYISRVDLIAELTLLKLEGKIQGVIGDSLELPL